MTTDKKLEILNWIKIFETDSDEEREAMDEAMDAVRMTMGISGLGENPDPKKETETRADRKWIPCSKKLPEILPEKIEVDENGKYFYQQSKCCSIWARITKRDGEEEQFYGIGRLNTDDGGKTTYWSGIDEDGVWTFGPRVEVLAWEPMLDPYTKEGAGE